MRETGSARRAAPWDKGEPPVDMGITARKVALNRRDAAPWTKDDAAPTPVTRPREDPPWAKDQSQPRTSARRYTDRSAPWTKDQARPPTAGTSRPEPAPWTRNEGASPAGKGGMQPDSYRAPWSKGDALEPARREPAVRAPYQDHHGADRHYPQQIVSEGGVTIGSVQPSGSRPRSAMETLLDPSLARKLELKHRGKKNRNFMAKNAREAVVSPEPEESEVAPTAKYGMLDSQRPIPKKYRDVKSKFRTDPGVMKHRTEHPLHMHSARNDRDRIAANGASESDPGSSDGESVPSRSVSASVASVGKFRLGLKKNRETLANRAQGGSKRLLTAADRLEVEGQGSFRGRKASSRPDSSRPASARPASAIRPGSSRPTATGAMPSYLKKRRSQWKADAAAKAEDARVTEGAPPGHVLMPENERVGVLAGLGVELAEALAALRDISVTSDTLRTRQHRSAIDRKVTDLEDGIRFFSRKKVFIKDKSRSAT